MLRAIRLALLAGIVFSTPGLNQAFADERKPTTPQEQVMDAEKLKHLSDDELMAYIQVQANSGAGIELTRAQAELNARFNDKAQRTHWTTLPMFWATVIAMIAACIAAYPIVRSWWDAWKASAVQEAPPPDSK